MSWNGRTTEPPREPAQSVSPRTATATGEPPHALQAATRGPYTGPNVEDNTRPASSRSLGIHGLINPANPPSSERRLPEAQTSPHGGPVSHLSTPTGTPRPYIFSGHAPAPSVTTPLAHTPGSERGSPATAFPFPTINNPRQVASPFSGPSADLKRGAPERYGSSVLPELSPTLTPDPSLPRFSERGSETSPSGQNVQGIHALPFPGPRPTERPSAGVSHGMRSMSQPIIPYPRLGNHVQQQDSNRQPHWPAQHGPPPPDHHGHPSPTTTPNPHQAPDEPVGTPLYRTLLSVAANGGFDGQTMLRMASGPGGEPLDIVLDTNNASRQMDEKRQRNATASHRHRYRKKEERQMLESEHRELKARLAAVEHERDFYRAERARLRDILLRTPFADQAAGPPSPSPSAPLSLPEGSSSDPGSLRAGTSRPASAAPMTERPARRRRTNKTTGTGQPSYAPVSPRAAALPPIAGSAYGSSSEPSPPLSAGARLPSLRAVEGMGRDNLTAPTAGGPPYQSYARVPHETGWVHQMSEPTGLAHPFPQGNPHAQNPYHGQQNPHDSR